jgi:intracellular sulfur oxidation DsrE/DsrF family protein
VEARVDAHYDELNSVIGQFSVGRHSIPVVLIQSPEEKYRARVAKQENVDTLEKSLLSFRSVNEHVEVVLFMPAKKSLNGFKPPQTAEEMKARGMEGYFTVCGDHTLRAMNQLHARFKNNPKWASLSCTVYVCQRTPENYAYLKSWGILDNVKGEKRVAVSFFDKLVALKPDLVVGFSDLQADIARELARRGIPVVIFNQRSIAEILQTIHSTAALVGASEPGTALVDELVAHLHRVEASSPSRRPRVYFEEWPDPCISAIRWVSELIDVAGGSDIFEHTRARHDRDACTTGRPRDLGGQRFGRAVRVLAHGAESLCHPHGDGDIAG